MSEGRCLRCGGGTLAPRPRHLLQERQSLRRKQTLGGLNIGQARGGETCEGVKHSNQAPATFWQNSLNWYSSAVHGHKTKRERNLALKKRRTRVARSSPSPHSLGGSPLFLANTTSHRNSASHSLVMMLNKNVLTVMSKKFCRVGSDVISAPFCRGDDDQSTHARHCRCRGCPSWTWRFW